MLIKMHRRWLHPFIEFLLELVCRTVRDVFEFADLEGHRHDDLNDRI